MTVSRTRPRPHFSICTQAFPIVAYETSADASDIIVYTRASPLCFVLGDGQAVMCRFRQARLRVEGFA